MRKFSVILSVLCLSLVSANAMEVWWKWFNPELDHVEQERAAAADELSALGSPMVGQTTLEIGFQSVRYDSPPIGSAWVQLDLLHEQKIDTIALVPAVVDWRSSERSAFAFPCRFRVDISDDPQFKSAIPVGVFTEKDFPNPGLVPVLIHAGGKKARYIRITITKFAEENHQYFYALSEIMVLSGNLNVALGCSIRATALAHIPPRWALANLVDGRTALGPPIHMELLSWDGLYAGHIEGVKEPWMLLDLKTEFPLQQIRLHPIHSRLGADVPGFAFPKHLKVEVGSAEDFSDAKILFDSKNFSNPGDNPFTIWATNCTARFIKITCVESEIALENRFGLSEVEVFSNGTNVAPGSIITRTGEPVGKHRSWNWPVSLLVDGFTSYGRLVELPEWLQNWEQRQQLQNHLSELDERESVLMALARRRMEQTGVGVAIVVLLSASGLVISARHRRKRELRELRLRLARDIHDDIGSNLAGIAVLSEVAHDSISPEVQREDWREVNRIARDTLDAMREVLWLVGGREEAGLDLMTHLQLAATRMLAGKEIYWKSKVDHVPPEISLELRRQLFLFFKEALTNVVRHSGASRVELALQISRRCLFLSVVDNGCGFEPKKIRNGIGLNSQRMRARAMGATLRIHSEPGKGTGVFLEIPLSKLARHLPFRRKSRVLTT